jgi:mono/diheme cytochrome c family protein
VANLCLGCHGPGLAGGKIPGGPPDWPAASNLTPGPGTVMTAYDTADKLKAMFRSGKRANGTPIAVMPFDTLRELNDIDVAAVLAYLKTLPPLPAGK